MNNYLETEPSSASWPFNLKTQNISEIFNLFQRKKNFSLSPKIASPLNKNFNGLFWLNIKCKKVDENTFRR